MKLTSPFTKKRRYDFNWTRELKFTPENNPELTDDSSTIQLKQETNHLQPHLNIAEILLKLSTSHWNAVDLWARDSLPTRELLMELANIKIQLSVLVTK
jgi:hypothetical protein